jgi:hypothetical protein
MNLRTKLISVGLSAVTAGTFAFTAAAPAAHADVVTDLCSALPTQLASANLNLTNAQAQANFTSSDLATKTGAMNTAVGTFVGAINTLLGAIHSGTDTSVPGAAMTVAQNDLVNKIVAWSNANAANFNAQQALTAAQVAQQVVAGVLNGNICSLI